MREEVSDKREKAQTRGRNRVRASVESREMKKENRRDRARKHYVRQTTINKTTANVTPNISNTHTHSTQTHPHLPQLLLQGQEHTCS